jgi:predicted HicB family RNase H-like nuclease
MPKKKASKTVTKTAKAPAKKQTTTPVAAKGSVGFRLRMSPATHKQLVKLAARQGISQNTLLNQLIQDAK